MVDTKLAVTFDETAPAPPSVPPDALIILPVRGAVLFPGSVLPIAIGRPIAVKGAQQAVREQRQIGVLMQKNADEEAPLAADMHAFGSIANIARYVTTLTERIISYAKACSASQSSNS